MGLRVGVVDMEKDRYLVLEPAASGCSFQDVWSGDKTLEKAQDEARKFGKPCVIVKVLGEYIPPTTPDGYRSYGKD